MIDNINNIQNAEYSNVSQQQLSNVAENNNYICKSNDGLIEVELTASESEKANANPIATITVDSRNALDSNDFSDQVVNVNHLNTIIGSHTDQKNQINLQVNDNQSDPEIHQSEFEILTSLANRDDIREYMLILNEVAYFNGFLNNYLNKSVYQFVNDYQDLSEDDKQQIDYYLTDQQRSALFKTIIDDPNFFDNLILVDFDQSEYTGKPNMLTPGVSEYSSKLTFLYGDDLIIVYGGTSGDAEWYDNGEGSYHADTKSQRSALQYFDQQYQRYGKDRKIYLTGISKGGNKAMYVGVLRGEQIAQVFSSGGQGFSQQFIDKYSQEIDLNKSKIINMMSSKDMVGTILLQIGNVEYYKATSNWGVLDGRLFGFIDSIEPLEFLRDLSFGIFNNGILGAHIPSSMLAIQKDGSFELSKQVDRQNMLMKRLKQFVDYSYQHMDPDNFYWMSVILDSLWTNEYQLYYNRSFNFDDIFDLDLSKWAARIKYNLPYVLDTVLVTGLGFVFDNLLDLLNPITTFNTIVDLIGFIFSF